MLKFKSQFICDVCGRTITDSHFRIEWGHNSKPTSKNASKFDFVQVCHNDCSYGYKTNSSYPCTFGDIIYDQLPRTANDTNERLEELAQQNPNLSKQIQHIKSNIFE